MNSAGITYKSIRSFVKYLVDIHLFITLFAMLLSGLFLDFVIPVGRVSSGDKYFLGLHRHSWIDMHLFLALIFMTLVIIHVGINWKLVVQLTKQHFHKAGIRMFGAIAISVLLLMLGCWLVVAP